MGQQPTSAELKTEAAEWERRSLTAGSFSEMVAFQRQADRCVALAHWSSGPQVQSNAAPRPDAE
jgi:hypothetical protein